MAWFIDMVWWSPSSIRYFTSCLIHSAVPWDPRQGYKGLWGSLDKQHIVKTEWTGMTRRGRLLFLTNHQRKRKSENRYNNYPKIYKHSISCLYLNEEKPETLRLHEIIRAQNHSPHTFFNKWHGNLKINYCYVLSLWSSINLRQCAEQTCMNNQDLNFLFK